MKRTWLTLLYTTIGIVAIVWLIRFFVWEPYRIPAGQMENTLLSGDRLWVNKWNFKWGKQEPRRSDILVYTLPEMAQPQSAHNLIAVARCIGLPGDTIQNIGNHLYINGKEIAQSPLLVEAYFSPDSMINPINRLLFQHEIPLIEQGTIRENRLLLLSRYHYDKIKSLLPDSTLYPVFLQRDNYRVVLPRKYETILITPQNATWLHRLLTQYEGREITLQHGQLYENGVKLNECRLQQNYYWVIGDNRTTLSDSRTVGPIPHSLLIGRGVGIGYSIIPGTPLFQSFRTDRFFKTPL